MSNIIKLILVFFMFLSCVSIAKTSPVQPKYFPATYEVEVKREWITMQDGVRLSATFYMPVAKTENEKFPIVLEMLPYRKDDSFASRDYPVYSYLAKRGIAGVRVDIRGMGASEGQVPDREYSDEELNDMMETIDQLSKLPWTNGNIGLQGKSWSAINGIMTVMRNPTPVKATLFMHGSEDIYANDLHTIDGGLHFDIFAIEMEIENMMPAFPDYKLDDAYFKNRFDVKPWMFNYLHHQRDGEFWLKGRSLFTDYSSYKVPAYLIGGLLDGYRDFVPKIAANITPPVRQEMGPWNHAFPHNGAPGPDYEWRQNAVRWWHQWLNNVDTGIMDEPSFYVFMRDYVPPDEHLAMTPGAFWAEDRVVIPEENAKFILQNNKTLTNNSAEKGIHDLSYIPDSGIAVGNWWGEVTGDMRPADAGNLIYDSAPLAENKYLIGFPEVHLTVATDKPLADWVVRLEDVAPNGDVSLVTGGLINGAQRESRINPTAIPAGEFFALDIPMRFTTWTFKKGHRIRLVVTNAQYPMIWPMPYSMTTQLKVGEDFSSMTLPFVSPKKQSITMPALEPVEPTPNVVMLEVKELTPYTTTHDPKTGFTIATADEATKWKVGDTQYAVAQKVTYSVNPKDPSQASFLGEGSYSIDLGTRKILGKAVVDVKSDAKNFYVRVHREIYENDKLVKTREWKEEIPRDFQ